MVMIAEAVEVMVVQVIEVAMEVPLLETVLRFKPLSLAETETV
jgi:hypothetical protein